MSFFTSHQRSWGSPLRVIVAGVFAGIGWLLLQAHPTVGQPGVTVERAAGGKCQRCWKHLTTVGINAAHPTLCARCAGVVTQQPGHVNER